MQFLPWDKILLKQDLIDFQGGLMQGNRKCSIERSGQSFKQSDQSILVVDESFFVGELIFQFAEPGS